MDWVVTLMPCRSACVVSSSPVQYLARVSHNLLRDQSYVLLDKSYLQHLGLLTYSDAMCDGGEVAVLAGDHEQVHGHLLPGAVQRQLLLEVSARVEQLHHLALIAGGGLPVGHLAGPVEGRLPG